MNVLTNLIVVIISQYIHRTDHHVYTLNLYKLFCQLCFGKSGENVSEIEKSFYSPKINKISLILVMCRFGSLQDTSDIKSHEAR